MQPASVAGLRYNVHGKLEVLIQWRDLPDFEASWEEFEFLKTVGDLSVKEFHIIQLTKKQITALQEILGPLGPSPMALLVKNLPASAGDITDGFNP